MPTCSIDTVKTRRASRICGKGGGAHRERRRREALLGGSGEHGEASSLTGADPGGVGGGARPPFIDRI